MVTILSDLRNWVRNLKFRKKLILTYLLISMIPLCIIVVLLSMLFLSRTIKLTGEHTSQMINQVSHSVDSYLGSIDKTGEYFAEILREEQISGKQAAWDKTLSQITNSHNEIDGIIIVRADKSYILKGLRKISIHDEFQDEEWFKLAAQTPDKMVLVPNITGRNVASLKKNSADNIFCVARVITDLKGKIIGAVLFDVRHDIIKSSIDKITIGENGFVFVVDENNQVIYTQENNIVYRVHPKWFQDDNSISGTVSVKGKKYQIFNQYSEYTGWKTVGVISLNEFMANIYSILLILASVVIVFVSIILFVSLKLSKNLTMPITKLQTLMKQTESGDWSVRFNSKYNDEIGNLGKSFNHMLEQMQKLLDLVYEEQQLKKEAEFKILQEQIKPHFLYNTLDTINWMARDYDADDIIKLVEAMTTMFRIGLSQGKRIISVSEEITHVSNYLYIQKIRYKSKLSYEVIMDDSIKNYEIPKLILQPLVENAIYHGIKQKRGGGSITITACKKDFLSFIIEDTGNGMEEDKLKKINSMLSSTSPKNTSKSFGLFYVKEQIRQTFGDNGKIFVESKEGAGTRVIIEILIEP